ncbi:MAG: tRNA (adenosine(37)-N6)-threonylcarbamoyltransferase complex transferase subunit TsaD [Candidatus Aminicenantes bacterium]|nr:tRNA (adenosine(37)-N6)-threonylcarbamoyltransferase complex transferase subunit TsaD [Candidatus Aminicenantes bacterium]
MKCLMAIETSCDETSAAVVTFEREVKSNIVLSQDVIHAPFGGVVPELASRQHLRNLLPVIKEALNRANVSLEKIDAFAVTQGPGLIGSLLVGVSLAKALAYYYNRPLIGIDHLQAHIESVFLTNSEISFPALALVVSGGHTSLFYLPKRLTYQLLGRTRDDAAGEAFDKIAKFLHLGYPGGPIIEKLAEKGNSKAFIFAVPRMKDNSLDFSFSGLKTAALRYIKENQITASSPQIKDFVASFEAAVVEALLVNLSQAITYYPVESILLCGGVARNQRLRTNFLQLGHERGVKAYLPLPEYCTDNAAMVGALAVEFLKSGSPLPSPLDLEAYARFSATLEEIES